MAIRKVGTCEVKREIGRGGMGVVYEARQESLERTVAIKALDAKLARSKELVERFRREGRAYAQLRHQAIVAVHDLVEKEDTLYLITDFVDGADLTKILAKGGTLPTDCAAIMGARVAEALDYVHFNHLLHRDVKPANIMVSRDGEVKLMDFGIAKDQRETDLTRAGMLVGSPSYLAPEVLGGDAAEELVGAIRKGSFRRVRSLVPDCPRRLARAVEKCLEVKPRARWKTAGAFARELDACASKLLGGMHPQARLVALMTHRGFAKEEEALTRIDAASLLATRAVDEPGVEGPTSPFILKRQRRRLTTALVVAAAVAVALGIWLMPLPFRF
jgi:tRNA A-37 threonylcarbamoyl transferase component Bud32